MGKLTQSSGDPTAGVGLKSSNQLGPQDGYIFMSQQEEDTAMAKADTSKIRTANFKGSSTLLRADFDPLTDSLKVYFKSGGIYVYVGVDRSVFVKLAESESAGSYFVANIRDAYDFIRLDA